MAAVEERKNNYEEIEKELGLDQDDDADAPYEDEEEEDYEEDDDWDDDDDGPVSKGGRAAAPTNGNGAAAASARATNQDQLFAKVQNRINLEPLHEDRSSVEKSVVKQERKEDEMRCAYVKSAYALESLVLLCRNPSNGRTR